MPPANGGGGGDAKPVYNNTTDRTNNNAKFLGSDACRACHPDKDAEQIVHGHAHKLTRIQGGPPVFPSEGTRAGVPNPPAGFEWSDISYVIGGYIRKARFINNDGFILIKGADGAVGNGITGIDTQWNLNFPANGTTTGFVAYESSRESEKGYDYSCFVCHTTGPVPQDEDFPLFQDNRPGMAGTFEETGVQCEACHGPGSNHIPNPPARDIFVNTSAQFCGECHNRPFNSDGSIILASGGFINHHEQYPELLASGGHATLDCVSCHNAHKGVNYDDGIDTDCTACHQNQNMALHEGKTYIRGDYTEKLDCVSCHMPYATKSATATILGESEGRVGDTRTHIFRINNEREDHTAMFTEDGGAVAKDAQGRAAVTVDFACLRCHNTEGGFPFRLTINSAADIALGMHGF
jgi:hypothetical protein